MTLAKIPKAAELGNQNIEKLLSQPRIDVYINAHTHTHTHMHTHTHTHTHTYIYWSHNLVLLLYKKFSCCWYIAKSYEFVCTFLENVQKREKWHKCCLF